MPGLKIKTIVFILSVLLVFVSFYEVEAQSMTASSYEINFDLNRPGKYDSEIIRINLTNNDKQSIQDEHTYIKQFKLTNDDGNTIDPAYITLETPFYRGTLDKKYRYLLFKEEQEKSWFKIGLLSDAVFVKPGLYKGIIDIPGMEWEVVIKVDVKPYVHIDILEDIIELDIDRPQSGNFHFASEPCRVIVEANYDNWQLDMRLATGSLTAETGDQIDQSQIFYRCENQLDGERNSRDKSREEFLRMNITGGNTLLQGSNYKKELLDIYVGVELGNKWSDQPAGKYSGNIIFTLSGTPDKEE
ncbi:MAG: hypothetical protein ACLFUI_03955 [Halanaerobiales bacterium]